MNGSGEHDQAYVNYVSSGAETVHWMVSATSWLPFNIGIT